MRHSGVRFENRTHCHPGLVREHKHLSELLLIILTLEGVPEAEARRAAAAFLATLLPEGGQSGLSRPKRALK
jgi:hypothetical protein